MVHDPLHPHLDNFGDPLPKRTSDKQVRANRLNAQRSTGPISPRGLGHSSFNGLKHGLYARDVVLPGEDVAAFDAMVQNMTEALKPQGKAEEAMVRRAIDIWWRLGRTASMEAGFLSPSWSDDPRAEWQQTGIGGLIDGFRMVLDHGAVLDQLGRYEARLERALKRTFDLLFQMQAQRRRREAGAPGVQDGEKSGR